ncbi:MAG: lactoylglutathione lyase, partial [uncultured archaeon A07HN63]
MTGTLDHVMMRVADLETSLDWYQTHLDYEEKERYEGDGFTIAYLGPEDMHEDGAMLELTENDDDMEYEMGDAWGHIAVRVPEGELEDYYEQLMDEGVEDYRDPESCGGSYAFVKDPDGHEVEIVQRDYGALWSLDHTMIRVEDADEALGFWARKFEYVEPRSRWEASSFANYFMAPEDDADEGDVARTHVQLRRPRVHDGRRVGSSRRPGRRFADDWEHSCCVRPTTTAAPRVRRSV